MTYRGELETHLTFFFDTRKDTEAAQQIAQTFDELCYTEISEDEEAVAGIEAMPQIRLDIWYHDKYA